MSITYFIHEDLSLELVIEGQHATIPPEIVEEIFETLQEKIELQEEENDEIQSDQSIQSEGVQSDSS